MTTAGQNTRLEAFCDGVFAIAATLLVIDIRLPETEIESTRELWLQLVHLAPIVSAFALSFAVIVITWANHHYALRLIPRSSPSFLYANALLLLTVAIVPFPTALLGRYVLTDHAAPAVALYAAVLATQGVAWVLLSNTALSNGLTKNEHAETVLRTNRRYGYYGIVLYLALAGVALRFARLAAAVIAATWVLWLVMSIRSKEE